jgi:hypothetical protein
MNSLLYNMLESVPILMFIVGYNDLLPFEGRSLQFEKGSGGRVSPLWQEDYK